MDLYSQQLLDITYSVLLLLNTFITIVFLTSEKILCAQALREELGAAERRSEEERAAHNSTKKVYN